MHDVLIMEIQVAPSYLDLYSTPRLPGRELVLVKLPEVPAILPGEPVRDLRPLDGQADVLVRRELTGDINLRNATPHQVSDLSLDIYAAGLINYEEYSLLAFQPELHPDFDKTIGVLTGQMAQPDRPRDYVAVWEDKLRFLNEHDPEDTLMRARTARVGEVLKYLVSAPTSIRA